jgi:UDP-N-acetyl-D-glucosamine dehydrogenase
VNICVPTPLRKTKDPDMSYVVSAAEALRAGTDFFLAFSPERVDPSNAKFNTKNTPKVVGGTTPVCAQLAATLYGIAIDTIVPVSSTRAAELVTLLENTFRSVNIGLVNELALMCDRMGIDVWEVIDAARTKPFGFMPFYPGPGLGGHCIPIDPFYLSWKAKQSGFEARFIELAGQVNSAMPGYVADKVGAALNIRRKAVNGSRLLVMGITYKRDIDDIRESPSLDVMHILQARGERRVCRPSRAGVARSRLARARRHAVRRSHERTYRWIRRVVILTDHRAFDYRMVVESAQLIVDARNALSGCDTDKLFRLGAPDRASATHGRETPAWA